MLPAGQICMLARVALRGHVCACTTGEAKVKPTASAARKTKDRIARISNQIREISAQGCLRHQEAALSVARQSLPHPWVGSNPAWLAGTAAD
jgi:hypothetical protein